MTLFKVIEYKVPERFSMQLNTGCLNALMPTDETIFKTEAAALAYLHQLYRKNIDRYDRWYGQGCWEISEDDDMVTFTTADNGLMFMAVIVTVHEP